MQKTFVLDTNVLLHDPRAIFKFEENEVVIPIHVIEEVDQFKKEMSELGRNARTLTRFLDELREQRGVSLQQGVALDNGKEGSLRVALPKDPTMRKLDNAAMDHAIMSIALRERDTHPDKPTIFVTMDSNLRIRADALGLRAENYEGGRISFDELYTGIVEIRADASVVDQLAGRGEIAPEALSRLEGEAEILFGEEESQAGGRRRANGDHRSELPIEVFANACVIVRDRLADSHAALGRYNAKKGTIDPLRVNRDGAWGVRPRNLEQSFALDLLLDPEVHLVTLVGKAGTGKTLLAIAAGLKKVIDEGTYARLLVSRPVFPLGRDIGYLPGDLEEKLNPWMQPIFDNLEYIFQTGRGRGNEGRSYEELVASGIIEVEPLTYIRGRSLPNQFLIVDEAQNLTPHEVKTIITRCGNDTKIVLTGDPYQIDNPYVDAASNGLSIVAERFKAERIAGHITLTKGERSELAERATQLL